jgi:hypothetical protein
VRQEVQGRVELLDRTRAGLLLGVERIMDTADEETRLVDPSAQDALRRAQLVWVKMTCSLLALPETAMP